MKRTFLALIVWVFWWTSASAATLTSYVERRLTSDDRVLATFLFNSLAISGNTVVLGSIASVDTPGAGFSGQAYVFDANSGEQVAELKREGIMSRNGTFATSVAIDDEVVIAGDSSDEDNGFLSGSAYLFDSKSGNQLAKLTPSDGAAFDLFGTDVAISGTTAVASSIGHGPTGAAFLFDVPSGRQIAKLEGSDSEEGDAFGANVAISGDRALVSSTLDDDGGTDSGSVYIFDATTGLQLGKLRAEDAASGDKFGRSLAIDGNTAIIGSPFDDDLGRFSGSAYLFDVPSRRQIAKLTAFDGTAGDLFGISVAIQGNTAIVGSDGHDDGAGAAYLFDVTSGENLGKLTTRYDQVNRSFGQSVGVYGDRYVVGTFQQFASPFNTSRGRAAVHVFEPGTPLPVPLPSGFLLLTTAAGFLVFRPAPKKAVDP